MAYKKKVVPEEVVEVEEEVTPKVSSKLATVSWRGKTREFSAEIHGKDYLALAESFAKKFGGTVL